MVAKARARGVERGQTPDCGQEPLFEELLINSFQIAKTTKDLQNPGFCYLGSNMAMVMRDTQVSSPRRS
jgi:hypothetical protein